MRIITWNVNGLRSAIRQGFMEWLAELQPDIICLQEIKAQPDQLPIREFESLGYYVYICPARKLGYSGTLVLTKVEAISVNCKLGDERFDSEGRMVGLSFPDFQLINFYLPHGGRQKENLDYKLACYKLITEKLARARNCILAGDFNIARAEIDLARPKQNQNNVMFTLEERQAFSGLLKSGFTDSFRHLYPDVEGAYTWWPYMAKARERNLGWRIDYILVSDDLAEEVRENKVLCNVEGSDHCPVYIDLTSKKEE